MSATPLPLTMGHPTSVDEALVQLARPGSAPIAGATWMMRAGLRHEQIPSFWVSLDGIDALHQLELGSKVMTLGAMITHDRMASALPDAPDLRALVMAANGSANPGVRRIATLGGNLCASGFAAADLVAALLALDATVEIATPQGRGRLGMEAFLERRTRPGPMLLTSVQVARGAGHSAHARLPIRKAGDYPVAIVSLWLEVDAEGRIADLRLAVGAVEDVACRWRNLEQQAKGQQPDPAAMEALARTHLADFTPRNGLDAPGWYRLRVLPVLVRRAFAQIRKEL